MRKRTTKLVLQMETIANLARQSGLRIAGGSDACTSDWFSCNGFTCATWEYDTCVTSAC